MSEQVEFEELTGGHFLSGVDTVNRLHNRWGDRYDDCQAINFVVDGKTYTALEDPDDGYRSMLNGIFVTADKVENTFPPVKVLGRITNDGHNLELLDAVTGELVLEIGTDYYDDYYPCFVGNFYPQSMIHNKEN